jgi:hypothetical protein
MIASLNGYISDAYVIDSNLTREDCIEAMIDANYSNSNQYVSYECVGEE